MLVLGQKVDRRVNLYKKTPKGPRFLGSVVLLETRGKWTRIGYDLASEIIVHRDETDPLKQQKEQPAA